MRWEPSSERCDQCGFDWTMPYGEACAVVQRAPTMIVEACGVAPSSTRTESGRWTPAEYVWHLADAIRLSAERMWTAFHEPAARLVCFDESALAAARHYDELPPRVAQWSLERAVADFAAAAIDREPPDTVTVVARRAAHEVIHHAQDIADGVNRR